MPALTKVIGATPVVSGLMVKVQFMTMPSGKTSSLPLMPTPTRLPTMFGGPTVLPATVDGRPAEAAVEVSVRDTGVGIAPQDQADVFEEFRQVGAGLARQEGTGLGLALCRKFVEPRHDLDVWAGMLHDPRTVGTPYHARKLKIVGTLNDAKLTASTG